MEWKVMIVMFFMQRLIPLAFRDMLSRPIWGVLTKLNVFFKKICATTIHASIMKNVRHSIVETICKLEKIFPLAFFDSIEHLVVHLLCEAMVGGPGRCIFLRDACCTWKGKFFQNICFTNRFYNRESNYYFMINILTNCYCFDKHKLFNIKNVKE